MAPERGEHMKKEVRQVDARQMAHRRLRVDKKSIQPKPIQEEQKEDAGGVKTIPAVKREETRLRVCSYCRVSTLRETQTSSIDSQSKHYEDHIKSNSEWEYAGTYIETGVTGTKAEIRPVLQRLLQDCRDHKIDLILTKSISRFARNTTDCLELVRYITSLGINIWFEKENINTMDARGEVLITIMSSLAQQESDSISKNVRMGIQYQMQQGKGRVNTSCFLGYTREGEELIIIPEQAEIVRRIYREYLEGYSPCMIAAGLTADNVPSPGGKPNWYQSTVVSILGNEKYCGDLLLQ